jgi:hypothetical protein
LKEFKKGMKTNCTKKVRPLTLAQQSTSPPYCQPLEEWEEPMNNDEVDEAELVVKSENQG